MVKVKKPARNIIALSEQPAEVLNLDGTRIDWTHPPKATTKCRWSKRTTGGKPVYGSFRSLCHLNRLNNLALALFGVGVSVIQSAYNSTVRASAGTHDYDAVYDVYIPGVGWWAQQRFFRANGFGCWFRFPPLFGYHIHGMSLPPREGKVVTDDYRVRGFKVGRFIDGGFALFGRKRYSAQIDDYYAGRSGLSGHARDESWRPTDIGATIFQLAPYVSRRAAAQKAGDKISGQPAWHKVGPVRGQL